MRKYKTTVTLTSINTREAQQQQQLSGLAPSSAPSTSRLPPLSRRARLRRLHFATMFITMATSAQNITALRAGGVRGGEA